MLHLDRIIIEYGGSPASILAIEGLPHVAHSATETMIPFETHMELLAKVEAELKLRPLGLILATRQFVAHFYPLYLLLTIQPSVSDSLIAFGKNFSTVAEGLNTKIKSSDGCAYLTLDTELDFLQSNIIYEDHAAALLAQLLRWLLGVNFKPSKILLPHSAPKDTIPYHAFFGCPIHFGSDQLAICFDEKYLHQSISATARFARKELSEALKWDRRSNLPAQLRLAIREGLQERKCDLTYIAKLMGMSNRTLQRRLQQVGTRFHWQLDSVRAGQARKLLANHDFRISDISNILAYTDQASFTHSFYRWYGTIPTEWRKMAKSGSTAPMRGR